MAFATTEEQDRIHPLLPRIRVTVASGDDAGVAVPIEDEVIVGTSEACDLKLRDRTASRRHLVVRPSPVGVRLIDQDSKNGTWRGDERIHDVELPPGTEVQVGQTRLRFELEPEKPPRDDPTERIVNEPRSSFGRFLGAAACLAPLYARLEKLAPTDTTVLLEGESGTGKELLAEAIHEQSARADGPFVIVDCGAVPGNLIESQLFGHEKGAFTGADRARDGAFETAHGGTIFLDEVGELPGELQSRLLRVLDRRQVQRIGSQKPIDVDVRVIAATHRSLERDVEDGRFRLDLFHRLAVVLLRVPPLRERGRDLDLLARELVRRFGGDPTLLTDEVLERMWRHRWPGNVRELRNYVERLVVLGEVDLAAPADTEVDAAASGLPFRRARAIAVERFTRAYVSDMLSRHGGNVSKAARAAGIARRYFQQLKQK